jgi:hypothetical protein
MSAKRIILKRSSLAGKRPSSELLSPGEIALNTNSLEPGLFFETTDGKVTKVGPTAVLPSPPVEFPEKGETWFDTGDGTLKIGDATREWRSIAAPYLGGSGTVVFVAPEFKYSSDSLQNDGQALPFRTISRAVLEVSKIYLSKILGGLPKDKESNRYTIYLAPSRITVNNSPGKTLSDFNVDFSSNLSKEVTLADLEQFNSETGGLIIPSGTTIIGMDLKKCELKPSFIPSFQMPFLPPSDSGVNQPLSSIFKCSGNSYVNSCSVTDKETLRTVVEITDLNTLALFHSEEPHGLHFNDKVGVTFFPGIDQSSGQFSSGTYYAIPYNTFSFHLSDGVQGGQSAPPYISFSSFQNLPSIKTPILGVTNELSSAHRLRIFENASLQDIGTYFNKVQRAFSSFFGGRVTDGVELVNSGDYIIVSETGNYPQNLGSNSTRNSSFYANEVNLRSDYGMCWGDFDGNRVSGFKSVIAYACTSISLQNDPSAYEIYTTLENPETQLPEEKWWSLPIATFLSLPEEQKPASPLLVSRDLQLKLLNETPINNIRYYYQNLKTSDNKSIGIVDIDNDFRHFGFRVRNGAFGQFQSVYTIGPAIGVWALNGGLSNLTNSTSNFGSVAVKSEGFLGINSIGGAKPNSKGFVLEGVQRPLALTKSQVDSEESKRILSLGGRLVASYLDPENPEIQILELSSDFSPCYLLPYSLAPGTAIWVETEECTLRGFLATDGGPTVELGSNDSSVNARIRIRSSDSTVPTGEDLIPSLGVPFIRRFIDPRKDFERCYSLHLRNTNPNAIAPQVGSVLRLNQTSQQIGSSSLKPNVQFDPGTLGGWGRIFTVDALETGDLGTSPQFNYVIGDTNQDQTYFVSVTVSDFSRPWIQGPQFKLPIGSYCTHLNRNWYAAENNLWDSVYYGEASSFSSNSGPYSISPSESCSPFVDTSVLERQDTVSETFQGLYGSDPYLGGDLIPDELVPSGYGNLSYFRGSTTPYPMYATTNLYDGDDGSEGMGLCLKDVADGFLTYTVSALRVVQTEVQPSLAPQKRRYRPAIIEFSVLESLGIQNPKQSPSVLRLGSGSNVEYIRVISLNGTLVRGIRLDFANSSYQSTQAGFNWPAQTPVTVCSENPTPSVYLYDPDWGITKTAIFRFFEVMGYSNETLKPFLQPYFWGERNLPIQALSGINPENGYALTTANWPLEFNQPSTVIANTHTWTYSGFYNYSRGLPEFQSNDFTRKLSFDFQATTLWSGRLTITGVNDKGEIVQFGPQRQALTANFYEPISHVTNKGNQLIYEEQDFVEFPSQVIVFSADDISSQFDGSTTSFELRRSGLAIPPSQLSTKSVLVTLGAVVQKPTENYTVVNNSITFGTPPSAGTTSNIRIVTSSDSEKTLKVTSLSFVEPFDGSRTVFSATSENPDELRSLNITANNTFVFLGGVQQIPLLPNSPSAPFSYSIERVSETEIQFNFTGAPGAGTTADIRSFCSGSYWTLQEVDPVRVYSLDSFSQLFNGARVTFPLTFNGDIINQSTVTSENLVVSLGGSVQIPGLSYKIEDSQITFLNPSDPPGGGTSIDLRVISNSDFLPCGTKTKYGPNFLAWGPGIVLSLANQSGIL